jgi:ABC-type Fe3+-hydroxamate transport system substrate-binding protein
VVGWEELRPAINEFSTLYTLYYSGDSLEEFTIDVRMMARILGMEAEAEAKIEAAFDRFEAYEILTPDTVTVFQTGIDGDRPVFYNGDPNSFGDCGVIELIAICADQADIEGSLSLEALLNVDPDVIVIEEYDPVNGIVAAQVRRFAENEVLWRELSAYQNDQIYVIPRTRARPATLQSALSFLDTVAPLIYPDIFPNGPLTDEQVQEILAAK